MAEDAQAPVAELDSPESPDAPERQEQTVTVESSGPAKKTLTIEIPESRIRAKIEEGYQQLSDQAAIPGFRQGRAPRNLLEKRFGASIRDDVRNRLLSESYQQALEEHDLDVLGEPELEGDDKERPELPESGPLTLKVSVEVTPDVALPGFGELKVTKEPVKVGKKDVDAELKSLCNRAGKPVESTEGEVAEGDFARVDAFVYEGESVADDAEPIQSELQQHVMVAGKDRDYKGHVLGIVVADLGKQLAGKSVGDVVDIAMTGPSGHEDERVRDQKIVIRLSVTGIHRVEPASVEELLPLAGVENEDELRDRLKDELTQRAERKQEGSMHQQLRDQLGEKVELELPEKVTANQALRLLQRRRLELLYQGKPEDEVNAEIAELREQSDDAAKAQLKQFFILDRAAKDLEVDVEENELNGHIAQLAMQQGRRPEKFRQEMQQRGQIEQLYLQIREHKTLTKVLEQAQVEEASSSKGKKSD
ncbi:MAG: trigger factor [Planctomycetota bacterium]